MRAVATLATGARRVATHVVLRPTRQFHFGPPTFQPPFDPPFDDHVKTPEPGPIPPRPEEAATLKFSQPMFEPRVDDVSKNEAFDLGLEALEQSRSAFGHPVFGGLVELARRGNLTRAQFVVFRDAMLACIHVTPGDHARLTTMLNEVGSSVYKLAPMRPEMAYRERANLSPPMKAFGDKMEELRGTRSAVLTFAQDRIGRNAEAVLRAIYERNGDREKAEAPIPAERKLALETGADADTALYTLGLYGQAMRPVLNVLDQWIAHLS